MYFLFSDDEIWHYEIHANSWRAALSQARDIFQIKGRLTLIGQNYDSREYRLSKLYRFTIKQVNN